ncbi:hypothetical protein K5D56_04500 [Pseudomonas cichorii]|nr:hypothetical protein [Pseudomonas cichorii]
MSQLYSLIFASQMLSTYGDDEHALKAIDAFSYARSEHGYLSPTEIKAFQAKDWDNGYCTCGLTVKTCPCGCFEFDDEEEENEVEVEDEYDPNYYLDLEMEIAMEEHGFLN